MGTRAREYGIPTRNNRQPKTPRQGFTSAPEVLRPALGNSYAIRRLRVFTQVVRYPTLTESCQTHRIRPPTLTTQLKRLEEDLGGPLLIRASPGRHRDTRQGVLTHVGRALLDEARFALDVLAVVSRRAHRAALTTPTVVATAKPGIATGMLQRIVDAYAVLPGAVRVETVASGYREQADMARDGRADVALLISYVDQRGLDIEPLTTESRVAALPADHPLAQRDALQCRDLEGDPMSQWSQSTPAERAY